MPERSSAALIAKPPRSIAVNPLSPPDSLPMGVRAPPTITDPGMKSLLAASSSPGWLGLLLLLGHVEVGDRALERLRREGHRLRQGRVRVDGQADVGRVRAGLDGQGGLGDEVAGGRPDD